MGSPRCRTLGSGTGMVRLAPPVGIPAKRISRLTRGSGSTGKSKGLLPLPRARCIAKQSRSYRDPDYPKWCVKYNGQKVRRGGG